MIHAFQHSTRCSARIHNSTFRLLQQSSTLRIRSLTPLLRRETCTLRDLRRSFTKPPVMSARSTRPANDPDSVVKVLIDAAAEPPPSKNEPEVLHLPEAFPPCNKPIRDLRPMKLADLQRDIRHSDRVLFVRRIGPAVLRRTHLITGVEDETGDAEFIQVTTDSMPEEDMFPDAAIVAIKQPWYWTSEPVSYLFVGHPSDMIHLRPWDERVPDKLRSTNVTLIDPAVPDHESATQVLDNVETRPFEQESGNYDFAEIVRFLNQPSPAGIYPREVPAANYIKRTDVRTSPNRGRGLFAKQSIKPGELILCEKAVHVTFPHDNKAYKVALVRKGKLAIPLTLGLPHLELTRKLFDNPSLIPKVCSLYAGIYQPITSTNTEVDGVPIVDAFHLKEIFDRNNFECPPIRKRPTILPFVEYQEPGRGLWERASYANHSCVPNTERCIMGDLFILRATRQIEKDEEIFVNYRPLREYDERQATLQSTWKFKCQCPLCRAEEQVGPDTRKRRTQLYQALDQIKKIDPVSARWKELQHLISGIEDTYPESLFEGLPRGALWEPYVELYKAALAPDEEEEALFGVLRVQGFHLAIVDDVLQVNKEWAIIANGTVRTLVKLTRLKRDGGEGQVAEQLEVLTRDVYVLVNGVMDGVEDLLAA